MTTSTRENGTRNIFVAVEPKEDEASRSQKQGKGRFCPLCTQFDKEVPDSRTDTDRADNLNTHFEKSFYETFSVLKKPGRY
ncbi:MAG: hypothetical protein KF855_10355 [Acidobacteria bacterium]|nr:hypothetical protein [Acidobacteriota bacterium]